MSAEQPKVSSDLFDAHSHIYKIMAMLQGTYALLENVEHVEDSTGSIWAAR